MATIYDLRWYKNPFAEILNIEENHRIGWKTRRHTLTGIEMTTEKAMEFIDRHEDSAYVATILEYGVTVYLEDDI